MAGDFENLSPIAKDFELLMTLYSQELQEFLSLHASSFTPREELAMSVLQLHISSFYLTYHLDTTEPSNTLERERFIPEVEEIIVCGESIVTALKKHEHMSATATSFCLDMGYISPIFTVAIRCRDAELRRRAVTLLRSVPRQEGLYNSLQIANAIERIMAIELELMTSNHDQREPGSEAETGSQPTVKLDGLGCRMHYVTADNVHMVEEIFSW